MAATQVNESDQLPITIAMTIKSTGVAATPNTLRWKLDCVTTGTSVVSWTSLAAASSVSLTIPATANVIQTTSNMIETKRVTVQANAGTDSQVNGYFDYDVLNSAYYT